MIETFLTDEQTIVSGGYSSDLCSPMKRIYLMNAVKKEWQAFSKAEKEQALQFLKTNTKPRVKLEYTYWFLTTYRNLDTGRSYKAIGCSQREPGICLSQFKRYLGVK